MSVIIIHRPSAATKAFVSVLSSSGTGPELGLLHELSNKDQLTECEANWLKHQLAQYAIETVPA